MNRRRGLMWSALVAAAVLGVSIAVGVWQNTVPVVLLPTFFITSILVLGGPDGTDWPVLWVIVFLVLTEVSWTVALLGLWRLAASFKRKS